MKVGIIGAGNMASALAGGFLNSGIIKPSDLSMSDPQNEKLEKFRALGAFVSTDNSDVVEKSELVIMAVKPNVILGVLDDIKNKIGKKTILSIAAGVSIEKLENAIGADKKIIRAMPNTPAMVGCGMTVLSPNGNVSDEELESVCGLISSVGETEIMEEKFINIATALHGSSPAYIYMLIDAMANSALKHGLPKKTALKLAAKAVEGSAKMVLVSGEHPQKLKDDVCSPGGTTIAATAALERNGFAAAIDAAIDACIKKAEEM